MICWENPPGHSGIIPMDSRPIKEGGFEESHDALLREHQERKSPAPEPVPERVVHP